MFQKPATGMPFWKTVPQKAIPIAVTDGASQQEGFWFRKKENNLCFPIFQYDRPHPERFTRQGPQLPLPISSSQITSRKHNKCTAQKNGTSPTLWKHYRILKSTDMKGITQQLKERIQQFQSCVQEQTLKSFPAKKNYWRKIQHRPIFF